MGASLHERHNSRWQAILNLRGLNLRGLALGALLIILFSALPARAQKSPACRGCPALNRPTLTLPKFPDDRVVVGTDAPSKSTGEQTLCSIEPFPGLANVTSVERLEMPPKAQREYKAACSALKNNRLAASEQHLRKALQIYPRYLGGWVMIGQIWEAQQQPEQARSACLHALDADPKYLASYLCLAEIAGRLRQQAIATRVK